jgi:hypothetical protein
MQRGWVPSLISLAPLASTEVCPTVQSGRAPPHTPLFLQPLIPNPLEGDPSDGEPTPPRDPYVPRSSRASCVPRRILRPRLLRHISYPLRPRSALRSAIDALRSAPRLTSHDPRNLQPALRLTSHIASTQLCFNDPPPLKIRPLVFKL